MRKIRSVLLLIYTEYTYYMMYYKTSYSMPLGPVILEPITAAHDRLRRVQSSTLRAYEIASHDPRSYTAYVTSFVCIYVCVFISRNTRLLGKTTGENKYKIGTKSKSQPLYYRE